MQIVSMKATMRTGTARRSSGSAVSRRRYAGLAIDCANPLIESERRDALAVSARAMPASVSDDPRSRVRKDVPHLPESITIESMRADLSRVRSQYFFNDCPKVFLRCGNPQRLLATMRDVNPESIQRRELRPISFRQA